MGDTERGIYRKFDIKRTDGSSKKGGKHYGCPYFVLDLAHDEFAVPALRAYAKACREKFPLVAADLDLMIGAAARESFGAAVVADRLINGGRP